MFKGAALRRAAARRSHSAKSRSQAVIDDEVPEEIGLSIAHVDHADLLEHAQTGDVPWEGACDDASDVTLRERPPDDRACALRRVAETLNLGVDSVTDLDSPVLVGAPVEHDAADNLARVSRDENTRSPEPALGILAELLERTRERALDERLAWPRAWELCRDETLGRRAILDEHGLHERPRDRHEVEAVCHERVHALVVSTKAQQGQHRDASKPLVFCSALRHRVERMLAGPLQPNPKKGRGCVIILAIVMGLFTLVVVGSAIVLGLFATSDAGKGTF
jgi:hypothetical protein